MEFEIDTADALSITDNEISELLNQVYVEAGYTTADEAMTLFEPGAVRERGILIGARQKQHSDLAGMIILVPPESPARRLAQGNEAEIHLLGVKAGYRRHGLGQRLVGSVINRAKQSGYTKIILWTQDCMNSAQKLYATTGFVHIDNMHRNGRDFIVYEMVL